VSYFTSTAHLDIGPTWSGSISASWPILCPLDPGKELGDGPVIGQAGVLVADGGGEDFEETAGSVIPSRDDFCNQMLGMVGHPMALGCERGTKKKKKTGQIRTHEIAGRRWWSRPS
jgi:hypothetical protein